MLALEQARVATVSAIGLINAFAWGVVVWLMAAAVTLIVVWNGVAK